MTETPNNQRRRPSQSRGLRSRQRARNSENQNNQRQNSQAPRTQHANRHRKTDSAKNGAKPAQRRKPSHPRTPHSKLDSEADFRLARPAALQQQTHHHHDDTVLFSQTQTNGNRRGKPIRNGQQWTPSDGGIYLHELRGSDWYREDQARYAAKQIALENAEQRRANGEKYQNGESGQPRRQPPRPRNSRNSRHKQTSTQNSRASDIHRTNSDTGTITAAATSTNTEQTTAKNPESLTSTNAKVTPELFATRAADSNAATDIQQPLSPEISRNNSTAVDTSLSTGETPTEDKIVAETKRRSAATKSKKETDTTQATASTTEKPAAKTTPKRTKATTSKRQTNSVKSARSTTAAKSVDLDSEKPKPARKAASTKPAKKTTTRTRKASNKETDNEHKEGQ